MRFGTSFHVLASDSEPWGYLLLANSGYESGYWRKFSTSWLPVPCIVELDGLLNCAVDT